MGKNLCPSPVLTSMGRIGIDTGGELGSSPPLSLSKKRSYLSIRLSIAFEMSQREIISSVQKSLKRTIR